MNNKRKEDDSIEIDYDIIDEDGLMISNDTNKWKKYIKLAEKFAPLMYLHQNENYKPCSVKWYEDNAILRKKNNNNNNNNNNSNIKYILEWKFSNVKEKKNFLAGEPLVNGII
jgi:hypothetical protein